MTESNRQQHFEIPDPWSLPIAEIDVADHRLLHEDKHWDFFRRLRLENPVHLFDNGVRRYWSITKFDDCLYVDKHHELFSSARGIVIADRAQQSSVQNAGPVAESNGNPGDGNSFIGQDPPDHDQQRAVVSPVVAPPNLARMESTIRARAGSILDSLPIGETFNWVDRVAVELTTQMLATLFDFPFADRHLLPYWTEIILGDGDHQLTGEERQMEMYRCLQYFNKLWAERASAPPQPDLISMMAHSKDTKDMSQAQFLGNLMLLITGGNDTTRNTISGGVLALNEHPAEYDKLQANPALIASMVPEIIRWQTPVVHMARTTTREVEIRGTRIPANERVVMWYVSGNRDEDAIDRPDAFIIDRPNPRRHLSFGFGIHRCMGNRLAEMQVRILWEEILKRFAKVEVVGDPVRNFSILVRGYLDLPVRLVPR